ncbi:MAG: PadR family transcriptional regulator [Candidatus Methylomirabilales bacterium]
MLRELFLGFIRVHILFHAAEEPVFGVALMAELTRHGYHVGPGTLYPILHSLEQRGYLRREGQVVNGKVRQYYRLTAAGRRILGRAQAQLRELVAEVLPAGDTARQSPARATKPRRPDRRAPEPGGSGRGTLRA